MFRLAWWLLAASVCCVDGYVGLVWRAPARTALARRKAAKGFEAAFELPSDKVVEAVSKAGPRVTAADVAAAGGLSLADAKKGIVALAGALGQEASIEVSKTGELSYTFPSNVQAELSKVSSAAAAREAWNEAKPALFTGLRIAFGVALFTSIAVIYAAIIAIQSSSNSSDRDRDDRRRSDDDGFGGGAFGGGGFGFGGPTLYFGPSPFDLFFYRPYYYYGGYETTYQDFEPRRDPAPQMGFLEAVYSFVFGDGDPNDGREQRSVAAVAALARRNGGVLTAEQMAPLLSPTGYRDPGSSVNVNENWVLNAISRLNGRPEVSDNGQIVYVFDDLQSTAGEATNSQKPPPIMEEQEIPFSLADEGQLGLVVALGVANLFGAAYLGAELSSLPAGMVLPGWLGAVQGIYPGLLAYAISFFAAPALRYFGVNSDNSAIQERNKNRNEWLQVLRSGTVDGKLAEARKYRTSMRQISEGDTLYSTGKGAAEQGSKNDLADFDRKLGS